MNYLVLLEGRGPSGYPWYRPVYDVEGSEESAIDVALAHVGELMAGYTIRSAIAIPFERQPRRHYIDVIRKPTFARTGLVT